MLKISLLFKKFTNFTGEGTLRIKDSKFSGYCFDMNANILRDFQICISVPLKFRNIQSKIPVLESFLNKAAGLQLSCGYCEIFRNSYFHKKPPVAASENFINFPGKHE